MALLNESNARGSAYPASDASEPALDLAEAAEFGVIDAVSESDALFAAASTPSLHREPDGQTPRTEADVARGAPPFFSLTAFLGGAAAVGWLLAASGIALSHFGLEAIAAMGYAMQAGLAAIALVPAILIWLGASAVAEAARAGRLADELARIARDAVLPLNRPEEAVKRVTLHVRREIEELQGAVDGAYARLAALRSAAAQHALLFEETIGDALSGADMLTQNLQRERNAFSELNNDLQSQTETAATTLNRQVRLLREAAKVVKVELSDAEQALETHLTAFRTTAVQVAEGAEQLTRAARAAGAASSGLDATLGGALGSLAQAAELTDAARHSTETAVQAANVTANSVREATQRAIGDAKAVADLIRQETQAMHATAPAAFVAMRETADAVRLYSPFSRMTGERRDDASGTRSAVAAAAQEAPRSLHEIAASIAQNQVDRMRLGGRFAWTNLLPKPANDGAPAPTAGELVSFPPPKDEAAARRALDLVARTGVSVGETLSERDLDAVAAASRKGLTARRKAVLDAAPVEVTRIARLLRRDDGAKNIALAFRKRSDLAQVHNAKRSTASGDLVRAYLLVDAALG